MRFLLVLLLTLPAAGYAQQEAPRDSLRSYDLAEIVVDAEETRTGASEVSTVQRIGLADIAQADAAPVADLIRLIPAAHVQTNSRGETLVYLRNAGERQVALYFNGALLNVPWDNRVDLSLLPSTVIGQMTVAKGIPSALYGTNVLGGAINLTARALEQEGRFTEVGGGYGWPAGGRGHLTYLGKRRIASGATVGYLAAGGYERHLGQALPEGAAVPYSQPDAERRLNTDYERLNLYGQTTYARGPLQVGASLLHVDGTKGVAPESHLNPAVSGVRYWRYPNWRMSMLIANGSLALRTGGQLRGAAWGSWFEQQIDQYASAAFASVQERQLDDDRTVGARLTLAQPLGATRLRAALNWLTSTHRQRDVDVAGGATREGTPQALYRQHLASVGSDWLVPLGRALRADVGVSLDLQALPETYDKPARDPLFAFGGTAGLSYAVRPGLRSRVVVGRKVRFPTMRELFGVALDRFLVNPELRPESSLLAEAALELRGDRVAGEVVAFLNRTFDTIDQRNVEVHEVGETVTKRQRVNLDGSRTVGVEVGGTVRLRSDVSLDAHLTWSRPRALVDAGTVPLTEKPAVLSTVTLRRRPPSGVTALVQGVYTGRAYGLTEANTFEPLPTVLVLNTRVGYRFTTTTPRFFTGEVFLRVDNAADAVHLPQLGLPAPGREIQVGIDLSF